MDRPPISDVISSLNQAWNEDLFRTFLRQLATDQLGVVVPDARGPGRFTSTEAAPLHLGLTTHGDGKSRVLAFADPPLFRDRFGNKFNAEMSGVDVFKTALANESCVGVLVNGASSPHSVAIDRAALQWALASAREPATGEKAWWQFWK